MKAKFKKIVPYILIILAVILLGIVVSVVLQFSFKGEVIDLNDPISPVEEEKYDFVNESEMNEEEITDLISNMREQLINNLNPIHYYNLIEVDPSSSEEDNEKYMVLTNDFVDKLRLYVSLNLLDSLTDDFDLIKEEEDTLYYKVSKEKYNPLFNDSSLNIFNYTDMEIYPIYANNRKVESIIKFKYCNSEICQRDDDYQFNLIYEDNNWIIDDIGYSSNE